MQDFFLSMYKFMEVRLQFHFESPTLWKLTLKFKKLKSITTANNSILIIEPKITLPKANFL